MAWQETEVKHLKKEKEKKCEKFKQKLFYFYFFISKKIYILLENMFGKTLIILLHLHYRFFTWQVTGNAETPTPI